jgi:ribonuclease J
LGDFEINMIPITHSIPEMNALVIKTPKGKIFHTGDWKFDDDPVVGEPTNENLLKKIGNDDILAMVGDSTNIFNKDHSGSEGDLGRNLNKLIVENSKNLIIVTTFASNVARLQSIAYAAKKAKRNVVLLGRSLWRIHDAAKESGYLKDVQIYDEKQIKKFKRHELLVICTGCQGELLAAMSKIANKKHQDLQLNENDLVIFSSKIIPGNEKKISALFNKLADMNINVLNEKNEFVHVSGHPSANEVRQMYKYIKPKIAIPVHGEILHMHEHARIAKESSVKHAINVKNGDVVVLDENNPKKIGKVEAGYYAIDGNLILNSDNSIIKSRQILRDNGAIFITLVIDSNKKSIKEFCITAPGVFEDVEDKEILESIKHTVVTLLASMNTLDKNKISSSIGSSVKKHVNKLISKSPLIHTNIIIS